MDHSKHSSNSQHDEYGGNIVEEIINLIDMIQAQINIITNSKDILSKDEDLIIFSYLLGYFTSRYHIPLDKNKISNLILEFSSRNNNNNNREELSNKLTNLSLIMNDNFIEEESMNKELVQNMETEEEPKSYEEIPEKQIINTEAELSIDNKKNIKIEAEPSEDDIDSEELEHKIEQAEAMMKAQKEILETLLMIRQRKLAKKFNKKKEE